MAKFIDYYKIMGVDRNIPQDQIKAAYRKRSKQFHPDLHPDDPKAKAKFQLLQEAYEVLGDTQKRALYDKYGEHWRQVNEGQAAGGADNPFAGFDFGQQFQGGFGFGGGSGAFSDFFSELFGHMQGGGGTYANYGGGHSCGGHSCGGGCHSQSPTETHASVDIDMFTAALGGKVMLQEPTGGKLMLTIRPGTQPGTKMRLKGKGKPRPDGVATDLILTIGVTIPTQLTERQKSLLEQARSH